MDALAWFVGYFGVGLVVLGACLGKLVRDRFFRPRSEVSAAVSSGNGLSINRPFSVEEFVRSAGREAALERYREAVLLRPDPAEDG